MDKCRINTNIIFDYHVFLTQKYGGVSRYFIELYKEFSKLSDVKVNIPLKYAINEYAKREGVDYIKVRDDIVKKKYLYKYYAYRNQQNIKKYLQKNDVNILHSTWYSPYVYNIKGNHKLVFTVHDMIQELFYPDADQFDINRKRRAIFESDIVLADSYNTKKDILNIYPEVNENRIRVIHLGVNNLSKPRKIDVHLNTQKYILFVGTRERYKNGVFILNSMSNVLIKQKVSLVFAGGGKFNNTEKEVIHKLGIDDKVVQIDVSDSELAYLYKNAECFVFPSKYEGFGFPILEAFAHECPVICSNSSSFPEIAEDAAQYFEIDNSDELERKVLDVLNNESLQNDLRERGKQQVKKFSWKLTAEKTLDVYQELICND